MSMVKPLCTQIATPKPKYLEEDLFAQMMPEPAYLQRLSRPHAHELSATHLIVRREEWL
jgi:hypothetical protein